MNENDFKDRTPELLNQIIHKPCLASGCIQFWMERATRKGEWINYLERMVDSLEEQRTQNERMIELYMERYIFDSWYKRIWNAFKAKIVVV